MMFVGTLQVELYLPGCLSLKEKRYVIKSLKTRLHNRFNVAVAEIDYLDKWQRSVLACASVSNNKSHLDEMLNKVFQFIDQENDAELIKHLIEVF